ncbi:MAG: CHAT domain-containing protein [Scytonematopsis contorta HA4267-MV1]|jgi:CHAT domain-containing protein|nr:CHAT domain-containing protein [Scytonematopsis contorta HA4267-MV1]
MPKKQLRFTIKNLLFLKSINYFLILISILICTLITFLIPVHSIPSSNIFNIKDSEIPWNEKQLFHAATDTETPLKQGKILYQSGRFYQAAQIFQQAAKTYELQQDELNQALALNYLSLSLQKMGQWEKATTAITTSLSLLNKFKINTSNKKHLLALVLNTQGSLQLSQGQAENALQSWKQVTEIYTDIDNKAGYIGGLINQATAYQYLGLYRSTNKIYQEIQENLEKQPNSDIKIAGLRNVGNILLNSGRLDESEKVLLQSLYVAKRIQNSQEESAILLSLGNLNSSFGKRELRKASTSDDNPFISRCKYQTISDTKVVNAYRQAIDFYTQSINKSPLTITKVQAQINRLNILHSLQQQPRAKELQTINSGLANLSPSRASVYARVNFAQNLLCLAPIKESMRIEIQNQAFQQLSTAIEQARTIKDIRAESYAWGNLGQLYEFLQQYSLAIKYTNYALIQAQIIQSEDIIYQWQWQLGRLFSSQGNTKAAIATYSKAVESLKSIRSDLVSLNPDIQFDFRDEVEPVYRQYAALLLQTSSISQQQGKVNAENLLKARDVIEALQIAEFDNFFRDDCITIKPIFIDKIVDDTKPETAIFYPIILSDKIETLVKLPNISELKRYTTYQQKNQVEETLKNLRIKLENSYTFHDRLELSKKVYNWIIKPAEQDLEQNKVKNLVFVLDGELRNIPMAALYDGDTKKYLIEKYSTALSSGLQLIAPPIKREKFTVLIAGLTTDLPHVETELKKIQLLFPSKQLIDENFTGTNLETQVTSAEFSIVHLATHGKFSSNFEDTFILAWDDKINVKQLQEILQTREAVARRRGNPAPRPIELLVLSACETATGDRRAALGLAGIAVRSGARSTLASLWRINDKSTAVLMGKFYEQLSKNPQISKAEALRQAQLYVLHSQEHPVYWAPYVLVGNWL